MAERLSVLQSLAIGVEAVYGTAPATFKSLNSMQVAPAVKSDIKLFGTQGLKYNSAAGPAKEWTEASVGGNPLYTDIIYPLASVVASATPSTSGSAKTWTFVSSASSADTAKSYSIEGGDAVRAQRFSGAQFTSYGLSYTRDTVEQTGTILGRAISDGVTLTSGSSLTAIDIQPILPDETSVYLDDTYAGLGNTLLTRVISASWEIADRWLPLWTVDDTQASFATLVEGRPKCTAKLKLEADAVGMGLLTAMRAGSSKYMRILSTGATFDGSDKYLLQMDMALKVVNVTPFSDEMGIYAIEWEFEMVRDSTWTRAYQAVVKNMQAAL